jgi:nucleoside-diphosphate-sugar epimerase
VKKICVITGGSGYIGGFLVRRFLETGRFDRIYNFDLVDRDFGDARVTFRRVDVREAIRQDLEEFDPGSSWIFNLAALCREPGSEPREYFDTNVGGAETVTAFAEEKRFRNFFFTSTMSSYGRMEKPTPETARQYPETPYGISKAIAEGIHRIWLERGSDRRLIICRPSVIFGPGDKENIPRMLNAVKKGYFIFPGSPDIVKGYGYIYGLIDSVEFVLAKNERLIVYNYAERECLPLRGMVRVMREFLGKKALVLRMPHLPLLGVAHFAQLAARLAGRANPIHPVRVRKVAFPTNLKPQYLVDAGFEFKYPLEKALEDWRRRAPRDPAIEF